MNSTNSAVRKTRSGPSSFPFYWIVITSLKTPGQIAQGTTSLLPGHITWGNYASDLTKQNFIRPLASSAIVRLSATVLIIVACRFSTMSKARACRSWNWVVGVPGPTRGGKQ
jgi:ABC-type glycerol-3-phosphate transport system permease component